MPPYNLNVNGFDGDLMTMCMTPKLTRMVDPSFFFMVKSLKGVFKAIRMKKLISHRHLKFLLTFQYVSEDIY